MIAWGRMRSLVCDVALDTLPILVAFFLDDEGTLFTVRRNVKPGHRRGMPDAVEAPGSGVRTFFQDFIEFEISGFIGSVNV